MRISDWSSDVCSSDLADRKHHFFLEFQLLLFPLRQQARVGGRAPLFIRNFRVEVRVAGLQGGKVRYAHGPFSFSIRLARPSKSRIAPDVVPIRPAGPRCGQGVIVAGSAPVRSEEHTSELQSLMRISDAAL